MLSSSGVVVGLSDDGTSGEELESGFVIGCEELESRVWSAVGDSAVGLPEKRFAARIGFISAETLGWYYHPSVSPLMNPS